MEDDSPSTSQRLSQHLVVEGLAGTSKTSTIIEGVNRCPETQVLLAAFNKRIAEELDKKCPQGVEAKTLHSLGSGFLRSHWPHVKVDQYRAQKLTEGLFPSVSDETQSAVAQLATMGKEMHLYQNIPALADVAVVFDLIPEELLAQAMLEMGRAEKDLAISLTDPESLPPSAEERLAQMAQRVMEVSLDDDGTIDFADMLFIPLQKNWVRGKYALVVIDEFQDMSAAQHELALRACKSEGRIAVVGDRHQCIYGFRGASMDAMDRFQKRLAAPKLPLTVTYRCPQVVVKAAQVIVPKYEAHKSAPPGSIQKIPQEVLFNSIAPKSFVLSRTNGPLVSICLQLLHQGIPAVVAGKDIAKGLIRQVRNMNAKSVSEFLAKLSVWQKREVSRIKASGRRVNEKLEVVGDKVQVLRALTSNLPNIAMLEDRIEQLFIRNIADAVVCSTVHRAKGLEADDVYLLDWTFRDTTEEELNIRYVALTRAKRRLFLVQGKDEDEELAA